MPEHCLAQRFCFGVCGGKVGRLRDFPFCVGDDDVCLVLDRRAEFRVVAGDVGAGAEQPEQRVGHGWLAGAVAADEAAHHREVFGETPSRHDDCRAAGVAGNVVSEGPLGERAKDHRQVIDSLDRGVGIVDRRGQCLACCVDQLPDTERGVLLQGPLEPDPDSGIQDPREEPPVRCRIAGGSGPDPRKRGPGDHVLADPGPQPQASPVPGSVRQQRAAVHRLHVARAAGSDRRGPGWDLRCVLAAEEQSVLDHLDGVALHHVHDRIDLDGVHEVVGEEHQQAQADEEQHDRAAHREPGETGGAIAAGHADRVQPGHAVGESRDEGTEDDLGRPVPQEVAQQPGRELGGRQLQGHHREAQHQGDDRHHRAGDADQQVAGIVGSPLERHRRVHPDADNRQQRPGGQGSRRGQRGQHPQRSPDVFRQGVTADHSQPPHLPSPASKARPVDPLLAYCDNATEALAGCWARAVPGRTPPLTSSR